ncbi:MAG TPA: GNAT family N-acetyltransferase [Candidatus Kryptonia bacterium]|nr:GNAT family N-acetyltransferase [Candidatus Kryptonia bacterium]
MNDPEFQQRVCDTVHGYLEVGNEVFVADGATFVRNRACPRRYDANFVSHVRCETDDAIGRLFERVEREFAGFRHRRFDLDPFAPPPLMARLVLADYECSETVQLVLTGALRVSAPEMEIRPVHDEADWATYRELVALEWSERTDRVDPRTIDDFMVNKRGQSPEIRHWLAARDGAAVAYVSSWPGRNGIGLVEDVFTHPAHRHHGLATALIIHAVADARARGAAEIVIGARVDDTPKHMYATMGFRPLLLTRQYLKVLR